MVPNPQHNPERPTRPREPDPHSQPDREGFRERGEGDLGELERGTGGQGWVWRLTEGGLGEKSEKREGKVG